MVAEIFSRGWNIDEIDRAERRSTSSRITAGIIPCPPPPPIVRMRKLRSKLFNTEPGDAASSLGLKITPSFEITGARSCCGSMPKSDHRR
jgi:hypothetical protein